MEKKMHKPTSTVSGQIPRCACIKSVIRLGKQGSVKCRNAARREMRAFQENEHPRIGTGWYWIPVCDKHFWQSELDWETAKIGDNWRWIR